MALTGHKNEEGSNQFECQVKKTLACKFGFHHEDYHHRCMVCNHVRNSRLTFVEVVIVVCIVGLLSAVSIYALKANNQANKIKNTQPTVQIDECEWIIVRRMKTSSVLRIKAGTNMYFMIVVPNEDLDDMTKRTLEKE